jgi:hypothetical protein
MNWTDESAAGNLTGADRPAERSDADARSQKSKTVRINTLALVYPPPGVPALPTAVAAADLQTAQRSRTAVEEAREAVARARPDSLDQSQAALGVALSQRQQFWIDTCCDPTHMHAPSGQVLELYRQCGCRFVAPTRDQSQVVLDALDAAVPYWDRDHPELFHQTLELNFPELHRHF